MTNIKWPPQFDGIKIERQSIFGRVKDTDIWIELDLSHLEWLSDLLSPEMCETISAWAELLNS